MLKPTRKYTAQEIALPILLALVLIPLPYLGRLHYIPYAKQNFLGHFGEWIRIVQPFGKIPPGEQIGPILLIGWLLYVVWRRRGMLYAALPIAGGFALSYGFGLWLNSLSMQAGGLVFYGFHLFLKGRGYSNTILLALGLLLCVIARRYEARPVAGWRALRPLLLLSVALAAFYGLAPVLMAAAMPHARGDAVVNGINDFAAHTAWFLFILLLGWFCLRHKVHPLWAGLSCGVSLALSGGAFALAMGCTHLADKFAVLHPISADSPVGEAFQTAAGNGLPAIFLLLCLLALAQGDRLMAGLQGFCCVFWALLFPLLWPMALYCANGTVVMGLLSLVERTQPLLTIFPPLVLLFALQCVRSTRQGHPIGPLPCRKR